MTAVDLTVLICTYNRARDLDELLETIDAQTHTDDSTFEVIVVDNNSTDDTGAVVGNWIARASLPLRYIREPRQGKSFALNHGLAEAAGEIVAIIDDDQLLPSDYLRELVAAFRARPDSAFIGGKVLPIWEAPPPQWLTPDHWGPIGMLDHGDEPFVVNAERPICLLTCAFRREDLLRVGGYREHLGVSGSSIGSTEDADILERLWSTGREGYYLPALRLRHKAPAARLTRAYYRRWHRGHGRFQSLRRGPQVEASRLRIFDVPSHMYRQVLADLGSCVISAVRGSQEGTFRSAANVNFFLGFFAHRCAGIAGSLIERIRGRKIAA